MAMDWDKLRVFHAVAEAGSFTHAGDMLNLSQSAVSRQVSALEESLQVPLFHRHARGLMLTEQGEILFKTAREILAKLNMAEARISESRERPKGPLKITTTIAFGSIWLAPRLKEFLEDNPDIEVSLVLTDNELDLSMREADVGHPDDHADPVRSDPAPADDLEVPRLRRPGLPAEARHAAHAGRSRQPSAGGVRRGRAAAGAQPQLAAGGRAEGREQAQGVPQGELAPTAIFRAVQSGIGIGALPHYLNHEAGNLVEILPELRGPDLDVYFVYPEELRHSSRITLFRQFILRKVEELTS